MKRFLSLLLTLIICCLTACSAGPAPVSDKLQIVATIFPEYDWVREVLGDNPAGAEVTLLLDSGVDLHSYQPTAADILKISCCDVFLYVGGESDDWVEDALAEAGNKEMIVINLLESLGDAVKEEEIIPGMQHEHEHDEDEEHEEGHDEEHDEEHDHDEDHDHEEPEYDEHVWLSLRNAAVLTERIAEALAAADAANAGTYRANAAAYIGKLDALDAAYSAVVEAAGCRTLLFGDRFPFRYLADDYGLAGLDTSRTPQPPSACLPRQRTR